MPSAETLSEAIEVLSDYHTIVGFEEPHPFEEEIDGEIFEGFQIGDPNSNVASFQVAGLESNRFVEISYQYNLINHIASKLSEETAQRFADPAEEVDNYSTQQWAAINIIDDINTEERRNIEYRIEDMLQRPRVWGDLSYTESGVFEGFRTQSKLYPYDEEITVSDYEEQLSRALTTGRRALYFLTYTLKLDNIEETLTQDPER